MKKGINSNASDEMRPEYDLPELKFVGRGIYADRFRQGHNLVFLEPDVAKVFPDTKSVNEALRSLIRGTV